VLLLLPNAEVKTLTLPQVESATIQSPETTTAESKAVEPIEPTEPQPEAVEAVEAVEPLIKPESPVESETQVEPAVEEDRCRLDEQRLLLDEQRLYERLLLKSVGLLQEHLLESNATTSTSERQLRVASLCRVAY
jgi:hypothetical protein